MSERAGLAMLAPCWSCKRSFMSNPDLVPSIPICQECHRPPDMHLDECDRTAEVIKHPLCRSCVNAINEAKRGRGEPQVRILPGAYDPQVIE